MAKGLPYFKFTPTEWLTGDIFFESLEIQGFFIGVCCLYWQRDGNVSVEDLRRRFKRDDLIDEITDRFISVSDGFINIKFLDEQFKERQHLSIQNQKNGKLGGRIKDLLPLKEKATANRPLSEAKATANRPLSEAKAKLTNIEEEEEEEKEEELELRKKKFGKTLNPYLQQYGKEMLLEFYNYWTETMKSGKRFRQESEKAWDIKRRLSIWQSRDNKKETFVPLLNPFKGYPKHQLDNE